MEHKLLYRVFYSPPLVSVLSQLNPVQNLMSCFSKIHSNIILPSTPTSFRWFLPFRYSDQNAVCISHLSHACYMPHAPRPPWFDYRNNILWSVQVTNLLIMWSSPPAISSLSGPNTLFSTIFSNALNLCSSPNMRYQVSHPYKTTGRSIVLSVWVYSVLKVGSSVWTRRILGIMKVTSYAC